MKAKIIDCYVTPNAVFYRIEGKIDMATILSHSLNWAETEEQAKDRWHTEQHWLADWHRKTPFDGYEKNCTATFNITSSRFYETMMHGKRPLKSVRNIIVDKIEKAM